MNVSRTLFIAGLGLAAVLCSAPSSADTTATSADLPVTRVALYSSGVGYFERAGDIDGNAIETLLFPVDQVNDVLKSLVLFDDGGGSIQPVTYGAQDPVEKQLRAFSIDLSDNPSRADLLNRLRGAAATVTMGSQTVAGTIVGVESKTVTLPNNGGVTTEETLNVLADDGIHSVPLADVTGFNLTDPALSHDLHEALGVLVQGRDATKRPVKLSFSGTGRRRVEVGYLTQTPLWQTTYRLVLGAKPELQGWALVQNTSQDDWNGVSLSLVSGRPISFVQDLYTPHYLDRPVVNPQVAAAPGPQTYSSNLQADSVEATAAAPAPVPPTAGFGGGFGGFRGGGSGSVFAPGLARSTDNEIYALGEHAATTVGITGAMQPAEAAAQSIASSGEKLGTALFRYDIKIPVTVPREQSAMIPFISSPIEAQPVSIYDGSARDEHPLSGARLRNSSGLHLMGGPLTVFDTGASGAGYVGDALIDDTEPGQVRLLSYAVDLAVDAAVDDSGGDSEVRTIALREGVLVETYRTESKRTYTFKNHADKLRTVVIEDPYRGDEWTHVEPKAPDEHTADFDRYDLDVPAGASKSLIVRLARTNETTYALTNCNDSQLLGISQQGQASQAVRDAMTQILTRRQAIAELQRKIDDANGELGSIDSAQERIRDNMKELDHASALYKRYVGELNDQETHIQSLHDQINGLTSRMSAAQSDLDAYVNGLDIS
ncbi:MAG: hypothetical protein ACLQVD_06195 [Capsulimonadaceae bacterium]